MIKCRRMPFSKVASGGAQERKIEVELMTVAAKLVGGPDGAVRKINISAFTCKIISIAHEVVM